MKNSPIVSIIVPVYNAANHLQYCIESILSQTYRNFELLLIDDGSSDLSGKICDDFALLDNRIITFHKLNGGVSSARNYGLDRIQGQYFTFIDADDWIDECHIQNFMDNIDGQDWIMQGIRNIDRSKHSGKEMRSESIIKAETKEDVDRLLIEVPAFGWVSNKMYRASIVKQYNLRFITRLNINEDRVFNLMYSIYVNSFLMLPTVTYNYVENVNSLSHSYIHPSMFISTSQEFDKLVRSGKLGNRVQVYTGRFCIRFYIHALGLCFVSPFSKLSLYQRGFLVAKIIRKSLFSYTMQRYKLKAIKWTGIEFYTYMKKFAASV